MMQFQITPHNGLPEGESEVVSPPECRKAGGIGLGRRSALAHFAQGEACELLLGEAVARRNLLGGFLVGGFDGAENLPAVADEHGMPSARLGFLVVWPWRY